MNKIGLFCLLATIAIAVAADDEDSGVYYRRSPKQVVYVEKESDSDYRRPSYEVVKKVPESKVVKKTVYEYREPEEKEKKILVKVVKKEDRKYVVRPAYEEPKKDVVVKILDRQH